MHRCPVAPTTADLPLYGWERAGRVAVAGGILVGLAFVGAATGLVRIGTGGVAGVVGAGLAALLLGIATLRPARSSCSVRRAVMGAFVQVTAGALVWLVLVPG